VEKGDDKDMAEGEAGKESGKKKTPFLYKFICWKPQQPTE